MTVLSIFHNDVRSVSVNDCRKLFITAFITFSSSGEAVAIPIIPMGSYLEYVDLSHTQYSEQDGYLSTRFFTKESMYTLGSDPKSGLLGGCWKNGHDIYLDGKAQLKCDATVNRSIVNAATGLYTILTPYGSFLNSCIGILPVRESGRTYLYASCDLGHFNRVWGSYLSGRLDITNCPPGRVTNKHGIMFCNTKTTVRQVITGSYLETCSLSTAHYDPDKDLLTVRCRGYSKLRLLENASVCVGSGGDIAYANGNLACAPASVQPAEIHTASQYIPPGSYQLTCNRIAYFPCMGKNRQGALSASCKKTNRLSGSYSDTYLEDTNEQCQIKELSPVINDGGALACQPGESFRTNSQEQRDQLKRHFQCPDG